MCSIGQVGSSTLSATLDGVVQAIRQIEPGVARGVDRSGLVNEADFAAQGR